MKKSWWILLALVVLGVGVRSYQITEPDITDFHAWRQADTAAFTHGYLAATLNPIYPSIDRYPCDLRGEHFGRVEAEFPFVAWLAALPLAALDVAHPPPAYLRAVSIFFYVLTSLYLFFLVLRLGANENEGYLVVLAFALLPLSIFFTRTIQPDGPSLFFGTAFLYHLAVWLEDDELAHGIVSALFCMLVLLLKLPNGYFVFPALYLFISRKGFVGALRTPKYWVWGVAVLVPVALWSLHAREFAWTFGVWGDRATSKFTDWNKFTDPATWRELSSRLTFDILTWSGVVLAVVALARHHARDIVRFGAVWGAGFALFVATTLKGNSRHIYYQLPIVLPAAILIGVGIYVLWKKRLGGKIVLVGLLGIYLVTSYHILLGPKRGWQNGYFQDDVPIGLQQASEMVRAHLEPGEKFVSTSRNPAHFFNSRRRGWFYNRGDIQGFIACTSEDAPYVLLDRRDRRRAQRAMRRDNKLAERLVEVERGKHYSLWRVNQTSSATTYLPAIGGGGGQPFNWSCPDGQVLRGVKAGLAQGGKTIGSLQPLCSPASGPSDESSTRGPKFGQFDANNSEIALECGPGEAAVGLQGNADRIVRRLRLICAPADGPAATGTPSRPAGAKVGEHAEQRCPKGSVVNGIYGRSGLYVDALGLRCVDLSRP